MFDGFTDDDLEKLKAAEYELKGKKSEQCMLVREPVEKRQMTHSRFSGKKNIPRERLLQRPNNKSNKEISEEIPFNARLAKPKELGDKLSDVATLMLKECNSTEPKQNIPPDVTNVSNEPQNLTSPTSNKKLCVEAGPVCIKIKEGKNYEVLSSDKSPLDEFQSRHKLMEEQNRRRKELLAKALADRKKQTHAEARRLQQIHEELQKLDALLSNDVGILRNQIEAASLEFMDAQKRYDKAEKEFLDAKLNLFGKLERKELLTEHLCKIIEQNEMRKAKKLSELMDKLDLRIAVESGEDGQQSSIGTPMLPTFCALDEVSYSACNTLKSRQSEGQKALQISPPMESKAREIISVQNEMNTVSEYADASPNQCKSAESL